MASLPPSQEPNRSVSPAKENSTSKGKPTRPRVWRACEVCRRRKIRCDGQEPCNFCTTNQKECSFTRTEDHAALARQRDNDTQTRLDRLESSLDRLIPLIETTHAWFSRASQAGPSTSTLPSTSSSAPPLAASTVQAAPLPVEQQVGPSAPLTQDDLHDYGFLAAVSSPSTHEPGVSPEIVYAGQAVDSSTAVDDIETEDASPQRSDEGGRSGQRDGVQRSTAWADRLAGHYAQDSSGNMRYLGGASTFVLAEAVDSIRQAHTPAYNQSELPPASGPTVDHLYFRPNVSYRPLSGLPAPETLVYPPTIISDTLVHVYFEKIHHTFPIIDKPSFLSNYAETMAKLQSGQASTDSRFLCVLFAVYASAASLTKTVFEERTEIEFSSPKEYIGLEFYEKALYMYWTGFRMMTIEHVTCMALLSSCLAGWNTLSQAWVLAGQALRGAQDLGLHRSPNKATIPPAAKEYRRRVWWGVYSLDKILSVSLGRPSGINDDDCDVELPSDKRCCQEPCAEVERPGDNPMTGIISLMKITTIAGQIERIAHNIGFLETYDNMADNPVVRETIDKLDAMLDAWSETLPAPVKFAANNPERPTMFALCLMGHFTLYACTLNLHRPFMPDFNSSSREHTFKALERCMAAALGCIRVGEEVKKLLPTSHHCQFCVQYLTISGVTLLRCLPYVPDPEHLVLAATRCRYLLAQLEDTSPGSKRCGALLQDLLNICKKTRPTSTSRKSSHRPAPNNTNGQAALPPSEQPARVQKRKNDQVNPQPGPGPAKRAAAGHIGAQERAEPPITHMTFANVPPQQEPFNMEMNGFLPFAADDLSSATTNSFDVSQLHNFAPFDLGDEIGALLDQMQNPGPPEPDWSQWSSWHQ